MNKNWKRIITVMCSGALVIVLAACAPKHDTVKGSHNTELLNFSPFTLPDLGYSYNALEPVIDAKTMEIHHGKHHAAYVNGLNTALNGKAYKDRASTLEDILAIVEAEDAAVRNNAGGHWNHSMFWKWITPGGSKAPSEMMKSAINASFGSMEEFQKQFTDAAKSRFGSGWAWLSVDSNKKLFISSTPNQDNPLMKKLVDKTGTPILGLDVWEHAYYLNYQNRRPDYVTAFFSIINWDVVEAEYLKAIK
jgi:Fe-Mn family superoxide dismutase